MKKGGEREREREASDEGILASAESVSTGRRAKNAPGKDSARRTQFVSPLSRGDARDVLAALPFVLELLEGSLGRTVVEQISLKLHSIF